MDGDLIFLDLADQVYDWSRTLNTESPPFEMKSTGKDEFQSELELPSGLARQPARWASHILQLSIKHDLKTPDVKR